MNQIKFTIGLILLVMGASITTVYAQTTGTFVEPEASAIVPQHESRYLILPRCGFGLQSVLSFSWNANETQYPFPPGGPPQTVNLTVSYVTVLNSPYVGKLILLYCRATHQSVTVTLEIGETPSWCTASLSETQLQFPITANVVEQTVRVAIAVDEHAPAYALGYVRIHGSVNTLYGPFGLLPFVNGFNGTFTISFVPGYLPRITIVPASDHLNVTPGNTSILPINITNHGNARTVVFTEIIEGLPGNWITYIPSQVVLEVDMSSEIILSVVPPNDFNGTESITLSFTPYKADDYTQHGDPVYVTIEIICEP